MNRAARFFLMRVVRDGPIVAVKLWWCDHGPHDPPDNKLDRGHASIYLRAGIAGDEVEPERVTDRLHIARGHWKYLQPISEAEYRYRFDRMRWSESNLPTDPTLRPRRRVDPAAVQLPSFEREHQL